MKTPTTSSLARFAPALLVAFTVFTGTVAAQPTGVYVANQGNFSDNNGSVTYHDIAGGTTKTVIEDFGTLVQSLTVYDGKLYVTSNTSEAVDVVGLQSGARVAQIAGVGSPRFMAVVAPGKAYVSNLYDGTVTVLNLANNSIAGTIPVGSNPEDVAVVGGRAYVANSGFGADSTLTIIDTATDAVVGTVDLDCRGPRHLEVDEEGEVWAFCNGQTLYDENWNVVGTVNGAVVVVDGASGAVVGRFDLDSQAGAAAVGQDSYYVPGIREAYYVDGMDLLVFDTAANEQGETITLPGEEGIGGVAYDPAGQRFYAARVTGFTTPGFVSIHTRDGSEVARFDAGVAPTQVLLYPAAAGTAAEPGAGVPTAVALLSNYPNPFNPSTTLRVELTQAGPATLTIYNVLGEVVETLVDGVLPAGAHDVRWDASGQASGVYLARIQAGGHTATRRLVLAK